MVGLTNYHATFTSTRWRVDNGNWHTPALTCYDSYSDGHYYQYGSTCNNGNATFGVWDKRR